MRCHRSSPAEVGRRAGTSGPASRSTRPRSRRDHRASCSCAGTTQDRACTAARTSSQTLSRPSAIRVACPYRLPSRYAGWASEGSAHSRGIKGVSPPELHRASATEAAHRASQSASTITRHNASSEVGRHDRVMVPSDGGVLAMPRRPQANARNYRWRRSSRVRSSLPCLTAAKSSGLTRSGVPPSRVMPMPRRICSASRTLTASVTSRLAAS